ncbi:MAG: 4Fe-4S dicluster domain-containing protein, partial [Muribaculaceae bacterium]|nr:4Fe-4S dicluster domain-containing protein [Muribaculaceae bacterium]
YCMPCPYGINIPAIFVQHNKCLAEDHVPHDRMDPTYAAARRAYLVGMNRAVERERQADHCIGCGHCEPHCPQRIKIPQELQRISEYTDKLMREE